MKNDDIIKIENLKCTDDTFTIRWNVTKACNYCCDFCIQGNKEKHLKGSANESIEIRKKICDKIVHFVENKLNNKYSRIKIFLVGGEVTILKDFTQILEKILRCKFNGDIKVYIITNLSADQSILECIKKIASSKQNSNYSRSISILASYYKNYTTERVFIKKIKTLHNISSIKLFLISKKHIFKNKKNYLSNKIYNFILKLEKKASNLSVHIVYPLVTDDDYRDYLKFKKRNMMKANSIRYIVIRKYHKSISKELKKKLSNTNKRRIKVTERNGKTHYFATTSSIGFKIDGNHFNPYGLLCDAGIHNLTISNMGMVSKCPSCSLKTTVGNILDDDINLLTEKMICPSTNCDCDYYKIIERITEKKDN